MMVDDANSLDLAEMLQEERRHLSWIVEDMAVLYNENSLILQKIKTLNLELENLDEESKFYDDYIEDDAEAKTDEEVVEYLQQEDRLCQVKDGWFSREDQLRQSLLQQVLHLGQDLRLLHHQQHHLPRHMWGHATRLWRSSQRSSQSSSPPHSPPPSSKATTQTRKGKLRRWMRKRLLQN